MNNKKRLENKFSDIIKDTKEPYIIYTQTLEGVLSFIDEKVSMSLGYESKELQKSYLSLLTPNSINTHAIVNLGRCLKGEDIDAFEIEIYDKSLNRRSLKIYIRSYILNNKIEGIDGLAIVLN